MKYIMLYGLLVIGTYILLYVVGRLVNHPKDLLLLAKNIMFYSLIGTCILLYVVGTLVAYSNKDLLLFAGFIGGACLIAGINLGVSGARRNQSLGYIG